MGSSGLSGVAASDGPLNCSGFDCWPYVILIRSPCNMPESLTHALSWTIADLTGRDVPGRDELAIALAMRRGEQPGSVKWEAVEP